MTAIFWRHGASKIISLVHQRKSKAARRKNRNNGKNMQGNDLTRHHSIKKRCGGGSTIRADKIAVHHSREHTDHEGSKAGRGETTDMKHNQWGMKPRESAPSQHTIYKQCGGRSEPCHHQNQSDEKPDRRNLPLKNSVAAGVDLATITGTQATIPLHRNTPSEKWRSGRSDTHCHTKNQNNRKRLSRQGIKGSVNWNRKRYEESIASPKQVL
ncbi:hypothetical protein EV421DRAFT_1739788 [Armillaria borealis]|uniref:Uncharacterized protein n=1 Tax=Armillaria borealis TaxID=47425 RepID=A0AA39MJV8_9AGAR|nr:hypothetical protein EV421DRAFT_1739788 [Armillaria borealis]